MWQYVIFCLIVSVEVSKCLVILISYSRDRTLDVLKIVFFGFHSFPSILNVIPFKLKELVVVILFTFLHECRKQMSVISYEIPDLIRGPSIIYFSQTLIFTKQILSMVLL